MCLQRIYVIIKMVSRKLDFESLEIAKMDFLHYTTQRVMDGWIVSGGRRPQDGPNVHHGLSLMSH
jgi:hypothetical protein